ncbi:aminotransferase class I/II-fold pyridoxal phosphate-dependent enzyme [Halorarius halobius]|uniref:aminotransferase class I/II-fold pyridoxal phosphate-dependent enzyme n=1 Tax=Halorarius halobius TaxID=2962671 RepID=UPI0020CDA0FF|nr:aminotransferase class I/II-fold pyridoxal phosphate-dependent enzyme [Halorarius halobius]
MDIDPFDLERFFARFEADADIMLAESGIRALPASEFDTDPGELGYVIPTAGDPAFRETLGERYGRGGDEVLCTCGAQEANFVAFAALMGEHAVTVTPTYQSLYSVPDAFGEVTTVDLQPPEWDLDVEAVKAALRPETAVLVVNNPNNPTGKYLDESTVRALYEMAADNGTYLLCDEVYRLLDPDPIPPVASMGEYGVSTSSVTKSHGLAGCRFGWLAGPREVTEAAATWKDYTTISPSTFGQHVARQAIDREDEILARNRELAAENRQRVAAFLDEHGLDWYEPAGVDGFVTVPDGFATGRSFCESLVRTQSVVLAPGDAFGVPDRFRIGFGLPTDRLEKGLDRVDEFLAHHA